jgi:hypothetical protein
MKVAERAAMIDRLARGLAWSALSEKRRERLRAKAADLVDELEQTHRDDDAIAWMLLDPEPADG